MCDESRDRFGILQEMLREAGFTIDVDPMLVRGLDYYNHTVFEVMMEGDEGQQSSLMGGGRYDGLVALYGGPDTPAMGFGSGLERVVEAVNWSALGDLLEPECDVAVVALGDDALQVGTTIANLLRLSGVMVHIDHRGSSFKNQLGQANSLNAELAIIIGENELKEGNAIIKDMESGDQETIPLELVEDFVLASYHENEE